MNNTIIEAKANLDTREQLLKALKNEFLNMDETELTILLMAARECDEAGKLKDSLKMLAAHKGVTVEELKALLRKNLNDTSTID